MKLKPVIYLPNASEAGVQQLDSVAQMGFPVVLSAQDMQKSSQSHELFSVFAKGQMHLISYEVEGGHSDFDLVMTQAQTNEWTHIIKLSHLTSEVLQELENLPEALSKAPFEFVFFTPPKKEGEKNSPLLQRFLDVDDFDYRHLKSSSGVFPVFLIQNLGLQRNDGLNDVRVLVHCLRNRLPYRTLPLGGELEKSKSWWQDKTLDTWLLSLSSFHRDERPIHSATSFAVGAFLACTPFYGLQTALIILTSMIFRLSFPVAFLGSQISLPPIYSLIVPIQLYVGFSITGSPFEFDGSWLDIARQHFGAWLIGSLIVGGVLSLAMGFVWFYLQKGAQTQKVNWTGRMRGGRFGNAFMIFSLRVLGLRFCYFLLFFIVPYFYLFAPTARRGLNEYYQIIQPRMGWLRRQWVVLAHLYKFAQILLDQAYQAARDEISFDIKYMTGNVLRQHHEPGARLMLFSHFGGWGISTQGFSRRNTKKPIHMIRYQTEALSSDKVFREKNKSNLHNISIKPGEPVFMAIHEVLRDEGHLAIMGDRPFDNNFELKNFLGRLAPVPTTPFRLAKTYKSKLSFVLGFRRGFKAYGLATKTLDLSKVGIDEAIESYLKFLKTYLEEHHDQWFNLYNYWSSLPTLPNGATCLPSKNQVETPYRISK